MLALQTSFLEASTAEATLEPLVAADLQLTGEPLEIIPSAEPDTTLIVTLPLTGATEGPITGDINFTLGSLNVQTVDGQTTASIQFDSTLTVVGTTSLVGTAAGGIDLNISDPQVQFQPIDPEVSLLAGGDPRVTEIGASFVVGLNNLPEGAALDVTFAKDISTLLSKPGRKFQLLAGSVDGQIGELSNDVAFGVGVVKNRIGDADLGDTEVTLEVSKAWFDAKISEGKRIFIAKFNDAGDPVPPPQAVTNTCTATTDPVVCTATLTGVQGSLSVFALAAFTMPNTPPVATAAFIPVDIIQSDGFFSTVATGRDPDGDPTTINAIITTPSILGLELALIDNDSVRITFDTALGQLEIKGPDPQATLDLLRELNGFQVKHGQLLQIEQASAEKVELLVQTNGTLKIHAPKVTLEVTAIDTFGASHTVKASRVFPQEAIATNELGESSTGRIPKPVEEMVTRSNALATPGALGGTISDFVPVPGSENSWSGKELVGVSVGAIGVLLVMLISVALIRRRAKQPLLPAE